MPIIYINSNDLNTCNNKNKVIELKQEHCFF